MTTKANPIDAYFESVRGDRCAAPDRPPPATLVRKIVKARFAENASRRDARGGTRAATKARRAK
jgi:hypothetical protein